MPAETSIASRHHDAVDEFERNARTAEEELSEKIKELDEKKEKLEGANEKVEQLKRIETGIIQELAFDKQLKQFSFNYQSELKESDIKKVPMVGEVVKIESYRLLEKKYKVVLEQNEKLKMSNKLLIFFDLFLISLDIMKNM